jgi:DNA replication protein DnaC
MGERFLQRTFKTFIAETPNQKAAVLVASEYARNFDSKLPKRGQPLPGRNGFLITGTKGTGKTHIAAAIANYLLRRGTAVICTTERNLFGAIRRTYSHTSGDESAVREVYERVSLLVIDDLGKEKPSEWTLATLYAIIDGRYENAMPLIITTNYDAKSLLARLTPTDGDVTTADAMVDRLNEMCESIEMCGESWRSR